MEIERKIVAELKAWKNQPEHKPLLIRGARQIGKTWAIENFGKRNFKYCAKFDFDRQPELKSVFQTSKEPELRIRFPSLNLQYNGGMLSCPTPMAAWIDKLIALIKNKQ